MSMLAERNAQVFLASHGLSLDDVQRHVDTLELDGPVIFSGSVPEGLANRDSDIDLLVLGEKHVQSRRVMQVGEAEHVFEQTAQKLKIHLRSLTFAHLELFATRVRDGLDTFRNPGASRRIQVFGESDLRILHRIRTGICLRQPELTATWRERLCCDYLPHYMITFSIGEHFSRREDAIGEAREGRTESAAWVLCDAMSHLASALLASVDESHPSPKWRVRLLQMWRTEIGTDLADELVERMTVPRWDDFDTYLRDAIEFADTVVTSILLRRPELLPVLLELQKEVSITTHMDEADSRV